MTNNTETLSIDAAETLLAKALQGQGAAPDAARSVARALAAAEAEGQSGHGFSRLADYAAQLKTGKVNPDAQPRCTAVFETVLRVDAQNGFAYPALDLAIEKGAEVAGRLGCVSVAITRSHHCGALSVQVEKIARAGLIGIMVANTPGGIAPWGASKPVFGTNPIAFSAPRADGPPLVIDLSLSRVARGKVMHARKTGQSIPEGWALDSKGRPTTDAAAALAGSLLPAAGAKGFGLSLCIDMMTTLLAGGVPGTAVGPMRGEPLQPMNASHLFIAIDPSHLRVMPGALAEIDAVIEAVHAAKTVPGAPPPRVPGEGRKQAAESAGDHVEIPPGTLAGLKRAAAKLGQALPNGWNEEPDT